tara:strand:- start:193 stop:357 length:165 start_codon:yes stop_codon:yes gene_type:complete
LKETFADAPVINKSFNQSKPQQQFIVAMIHWLNQLVMLTLTLTRQVRINEIEVL